MPKSNVLTSSTTISNTLISLDFFKSSRTISLYAPFNNEVELTSLLEIKEKQFVFPKVKKNTKTLEFYSVNSLEQLAKGNFGVFEPAEGLPLVEIEKIELFIVPGVAFSEKCERIGYGGGYYDTTLPLKAADSLSIGVGYDFQIIESGFSQDNDYPVDAVITEKRVFGNIKTKNLKE